MSPRVIQIPLSGGDCKAQAKGIRQAHGLHETYYRESVLIRSAAEAKIREADRLECEAWNAIMWAGGPAMPSPGERQAEPTIGKAINGGYDLLEAKCNRCDRVSNEAAIPTRVLIFSREEQPKRQSVYMACLRGPTRYFMGFAKRGRSDGQPTTLS